MASQPAPDWSPLQVDPRHEDPGAATSPAPRLIAPRPLFSRDGVGDRLRTAAFAEVQAEAAFLFAIESYSDATGALKDEWRRLAAEERRHRDWLLGRMRELGIGAADRPVSDVLWRSLTRCATAREFCHYMAGAEERGRRAGERFGERLREYDAATAAIFARIALEERSHIELAHRYYPL